MHPSTLPREIIDRVAARRGRQYAFPAIDPRRTALVVVDMRNGFVAPGAVAEVPAARGIVANINRLAEATRAIVAAVTMLDPHTEAKPPHAITVAIASPPRRCPRNAYGASWSSVERRIGQHYFNTPPSHVRISVSSSMLTECSIGYSCHSTA